MTTDTNPKKSSSQSTPPPSFVKLAMRNMVRKGGQSLVHLFLTAVGFAVFILIIAWLGRPTVPH